MDNGDVAAALAVFGLPFFFFRHTKKIGIVIEVIVLLLWISYDSSIQSVLGLR